MNSKYIAQLPDAEIKEYVHNWLTGNGIKLEEQDNAQFDLLVALQQVRSKNLNELTEQLNIFFESPSDYDEKGVQKFFKKGDPVSIFELLQKALSLKENGFFNNVDTIETFIREFAESQQLSAAKVIHPLRMALTGSTASPGIFELVHILGKDKVIERLKNAIEFIKKQNYDI